MITDSDRRCPYDGKIMMFEVGQDDTTGAMRSVHCCWSCGHFELDTAWPPRRSAPVVVVLAEIGQADG